MVFESRLLYFYYLVIQNTLPSLAAHSDFFLPISVHKNTGMYGTDEGSAFAVGTGLFPARC
jgi:hypothetical protein